MDENKKHSVNRDESIVDMNQHDSGDREKLINP